MKTSENGSAINCTANADIDALVILITHLVDVEQSS